MIFQRQQPTSTDVFDPVLVHDPVTLAWPQTNDHEEWRTLRSISRSHLIAWEEDWTPDDLTFAAFRRRLRAWDRQRRQGAGLSLFARRLSDGALVGGVTITNIRYGASRSGILGYWIGADFTRRGYGAAAVTETVRHAIGAIGLNRIEAACQPKNEASQRLLQAVGFQKEGRARDYLRINGEWRDHDIFARTASDIAHD